MCLIIFSFKVSEAYPLIIAANRDEFYSRKTATIDIWKDNSDIVAGRDLESGGTWMGVNRKSGKFAAVTNYRDPSLVKENVKSRGELVSTFLEDNISIHDFVEGLRMERKRYNGYNLLFGDKDSLFYYSNISDSFEEITPGTHGVSNGFLNTPWPKLVKAKNKFKESILSEDMKEESFKFLSDKELFKDEDLPDTGMGLEWEKLLAPIFIKSEIYGTRSSTFAAFNKNGSIEISEKAYLEDGNVKKTEFEFLK